jgi:hypothetical protein
MLLTICIIVPLRLAFDEEINRTSNRKKASLIVDIIFDISFFLDLLVNLCSAYYS